MNKQTWMPALLAGVVLYGCNSGGGDAGGAPTAAQTPAATPATANRVGVFLDSPVQGLKVVRPDGRTRLWHPDIAPYAVKNLDQPPIVDGLHTHRGKQILALQGAHFEVQADPETGDTRIAHPERANAYQPLVRFNGDGGLQGGAMDKLMLGVTKVDKQPDCPDGHFWLLTKGDLVAIRKNGPQWADELYGGLNKPVQYKPGTTKVVGALVYRMQTGLKRRNSHAGLTALT